MNSLSAVAACALLLACSTDARTPSVADEFTKNLQFGVPATPVVGPLPAGLSTGPQVIPLPTSMVTPAATTPGAAPASALVVIPGQTFAMVVAWQGGPIASVNMQFSDDRHFAIPVPMAGAQPEGVVQIPATLNTSVCDNLDDICHQILCYEQVQTPAGTFSLSQAQQMVLDCDGSGCPNGAVQTPANNGQAPSAGGSQNPCAAIVQVLQRETTRCCPEYGEDPNCLGADEFRSACDQAYSATRSTCQSSWNDWRDCVERAGRLGACDAELDAYDVCSEMFVTACPEVDMP